VTYLKLTPTDSLKGTQPIALNLGSIEGTLDDSAVVVRIYYENTQPASESQPLIDGPRGYCLDMKNK